MNHTEAINIPVTVEWREHCQQPIACPLLEASHTVGWTVHKSVRLKEMMKTAGVSSFIS